MASAKRHVFFFGLKNFFPPPTPTNEGTAASVPFHNSSKYSAGDQDSFRLSPFPYWRIRPQNAREPQSLLSQTPLAALGLRRSFFRKKTPPAEVAQVALDFAVSPE